MQLLYSSYGIVFLERRKYDELFASHEAERRNQTDDRDERRVRLGRYQFYTWYRSREHQT